MMRGSLPWLAVLVTATLALGVSGKMTPRTAPVPAASALAATRPAQGFFGTLLGESADLGPVAARQELSLLLVLRDPSAARQAADLSAMYTPRSPHFGRYLNARALAARYGPSPAVIARVRQALARFGLRATWRRGNDWLLVGGAARGFSAAFGVRARWYRSPHGTRYYASAQDPSLPASLRPLVTEAGHLSSFYEPQQYAVPPGGLTPTNLLAAYDITPLRKLGLDGAGQTIVFYESDGFAQANLDTFTQKFGLPPMSPVIKAGPTLAPGGETQMDLEVVHEIAPAAKLVIYNLDLHAVNSDAQAFQAMLDLQTHMVTDNPGAVISQSWGLCEKLFTQAYADALKNVYDHADALGESVFVSTGDNAAYECLRPAKKGTPPSPDTLAVPLPAAVPGVTAVGGTRISVAANGGWYNETVWEQPAEVGGTGGGVTAYFPRPSWQQGPGVQNPQYNPQDRREIPDVSADADPASGVAIYSSEGQGQSGQWTAGGGTSQSAPIWAGVAALLNQYLQSKGLHAAGFLNPALYQIAARASPYQAFHDITMGTNPHYAATPGYDMASGLGTPDVWNLARDLEAYQRGGGQ